MFEIKTLDGQKEHSVGEATFRFKKYHVPASPVKCYLETKFSKIIFYGALKAYKTLAL